MNFGDAAARYVSLGWKVFPLQEGSKEPWPGSRGVRDATTDAATIDAWHARNPRSNIGLACGASGLMVVDLDPRNGCWQTLDRWERERRVFPMTVHARTRSGGLHLFFRFPNPLPDGWKRKLPGGVDVQVGNKYVVAPPSTIYAQCTKDGVGGDYVWVCPPMGPALPPPPVWFLELLKPAPVRRLSLSRTVTHGEAERRLEGCANRVATAAKGCRNDELNRQAHMVGRMVAEVGLNAALAEARLTAAAMAAGLDPIETRKTIASGLKAGAAHAGPVVK